MNLLLALCVFTFMCCYMAVHGPTSDRLTQEDTRK
jgi:hypothetical protein